MACRAKSYHVFCDRAVCISGLGIAVSHDCGNPTGYLVYVPQFCLVIICLSCQVDSNELIRCLYVDVIAAATAGAIGNIYKQNRINPPPARGMEVSDEEKKQGGKNILRGAFLAFMATFSGCLLIYTAPDALAAQFNRVLPLWFYEGQTILLAIGSTMMNLIFTSLFR